MLIKESEVRRLIRTQLIKEFRLFSTDKDVKPGEQLSYGKTKRSFTVLGQSKKIGSNVFFVLGIWPENNPPPTKIWKNLSHRDAWNKPLASLWHDGSANANHKEKDSFHT